MTVSNPDCVFHGAKTRYANQVLADNLIYTLKTFVDKPTWLEIVKQTEEMNDQQIIQWLDPIGTEYEYEKELS